MQAFNDLETAAFCDQMALILKSGISSTEGISVMLEDTSDPSEREVLLAILNKNEETGSFAKALASTCVFPDYMLNMVSIGEETGRLDEVMSQLAAHYEREDSIRRSVRSTFAYPIIMIAMMIIVIVILLVKVMPIFAAVFRQLGTEMTGFSKALMNIGTAISSSSVALISVLALIAILGILAIKTEVGRRAARRFGSKIKSIRAIMDSTAACRFAGAMALTLSSGLMPDRCMELSEELNSDADFGKKIANCRQLVSDGKDLSAAIHETGIFSGVYSRLVSIGQKTGNMDESMSRIAALYQEEIDSRMNNMLAVLEPAMVIVISIVVGIILLSVMLPLIGIMAAI
ncbi:MAG: type II secretion system F family protein [Mogibacterium sp.]|nr:type II secretion system F family protein [Mogibacterium sp.]